MALSPRERTWSQLQENLRRKRQTRNLTGDQQGTMYNRYKKAPVVPLPRIVDSPSDVPLRGSHYPVIPPVANDRFYDDDAFSLRSYNLHNGQSEDFDDRSLYSSSPQGASHPYPYSGTGQGHHAKPQARHDPWNPSTRARGERRPVMDFTAEHGSSRLPARHKQSYEGGDGNGNRRRMKGRGRSPRVGDFQGRRHVWRDPIEDNSRTGPRRSEVNRSTVYHSPSEDPSFWREAFERPDIHKPVAARLVMEVVREESRSVVSDGVNELLQDYFHIKVAADTTSALMTVATMERFPDLLKECQAEIAMETVLDDLIDAETRSCVGGFLQKTLVRGNLPLDKMEKRTDIQEIARVAESSFLDANLLEHLLSRVVEYGKHWSSVEPEDRFLDDWLLEILLGQYMGILHNRRTTEECVPLKRLHERIVTDTAVDAIVTELVDHLQDDIEDLDDYERGLRLPSAVDAIVTELVDHLQDDLEDLDDYERG